MSPTGSSVTPTSQPRNPSYEVIADADADRGAWLTARKTIITATDVPAILGHPHPGARIDLFYRKRDEIDGKRVPEYVKEAGELGHLLEDGNATLFAQKTGRSVFREQKLLRSIKYPWLGCTLDYTQMVLDPKLVPGWKHQGDFSTHILELKTTSVEGKWDDKLGPCPEWVVQVTTQCMVTDVAWGSLSVLFGSPTFHHRYEDIEVDNELSDMIATETEFFWDLLQKNCPPKWGDDVDTYEVLRRLDERRVKVGKIVDLPDELIEVDVALKKLKTKKSAFDADARKLEKQVKELEAKFGTVIGENDGGRLSNGIVYSFSVQHRAAQEAAHWRQLKRIEEKTQPLRGTNETPGKRYRRKK